MPADESLCLSACMDLDQTNLINANESDRMMEFWRSVGNSSIAVPASVIFFQGERLPNPDFRWAPSSLLDSVQFHSFREARSVNQIATITPRGLVFTYPGCEVSTLRTLLPAAEAELGSIIHDMLSSTT